MRYLVCYDIADDRRRQKVAELLLDYGTRMQESVFECIIEAKLAETMRHRLEQTIDAASDSVLIFLLCESCSTRVLDLGIARKLEEAEFYIV